MTGHRNNLTGVGLLMTGSGFCALMYQVVWLRELRLIFGGSTAASAATLAIFMGGLGLGGMFLGKLADRHRNPLALYANLEFAISGFALVTPFLMVFVRFFYFKIGGTAVLGTTGGTVLRLCLAALVLGVPTFLMGGTLPAAVKAVGDKCDLSRRRLAILYGLNTLGAVGGVCLATFVLLNVLGTRNTLWMSCLLNFLVAVSARSQSRAPGWMRPPLESRASVQAPAAMEAVRDSVAGIPPRFIYMAALITGFVFFLMELVWYRMLGPLLGGSTYTMGLILAVALFGIGIGGTLYAFRGSTLRPTLRMFAVTCGLEALCIAGPYVMGDQLAIVAALLHPLGVLGMPGKVGGWALVTGLVVFPAAVVSGFQFPLLIGLLGQGRKHVGRHTGVTYAWNTVGAIMGSLSGGFGLLPLLSAPGVWMGVIGILAACGLAATGLSVVAEGRRFNSWVSAGIAMLAVAGLFAEGPTAVWRHSPIGAGRVNLTDKSENELKDWMHHTRRNIVWEADGKESSVGVDTTNGTAFIINGKVDGNARIDGSTQVMLGLISAILHPQPQRAMVIGLGTGSSAGWLADINEMKRVDVIELEPAIETVARMCQTVNQDLLHNPKARIVYSDAREYLMTTPNRYDLIVSEPSNPYRAGVASLYTHEFYRAVARRLNRGGMFSQWVQGYEVDAQTIRTIIATLSSVFSSVEIWRTNPNDMLLVCSLEEKSYRTDDLRQRIAQAPFKKALLSTWGVTDLEGFLSRFVADRAFSKKVADEENAKGWINTDDRMLIEFDFARTVGKKRRFSLEGLYNLAREDGPARPAVTVDTIDWRRVGTNHDLMFISENIPCPVISGITERAERAAVYNRFQAGDLASVRRLWKKSDWVPEYPLEMSMIALSLAAAGDAEALPLTAMLRPYNTIEADAIEARYFWAVGESTRAYATLAAAFEELRKTPWVNNVVILNAMGLAVELAQKDAALAQRLYAVLLDPFAVHTLNELRLRKLLEIASRLSWQEGAKIVNMFEPHVVWTRAFLDYRSVCYRETKDPFALRASADLKRFMGNSPAPFSRLSDMKRTNAPL